MIAFSSGIARRSGPVQGFSVIALAGLFGAVPSHRGISPLFATSTLTSGVCAQPKA
jgi:hypothetical protein